MADEEKDETEQRKHKMTWKETEEEEEEKNRAAAASAMATASDSIRRVDSDELFLVNKRKFDQTAALRMWDLNQTIR